MVYSIQVCWLLASRIRTERPDPARKQYDIYHCCVYSEKKTDDGQRNCPKRFIMRSSPLWDVTQRNLKLVTDVSGQHIGHTFNGQTVQEASWTVWPFKMTPIGCPETSVTNFQLRCVTSQKSEDLNSMLNNNDNNNNNNNNVWYLLYDDIHYIFRE